MTAEQTAFAILAGGEGRRIGGRKAHVMLSGKPMIAHVADRFGTPLAVVGDPEAAALVKAEPLSDPEGGMVKGPLLGLRSALAWARTIAADWLMIAPCDCPLLPHDIAGVLQNAAGEAPCVCVETANGLEPLISAWRPALAAQVERLLESGAHPPLRGALRGLGAASVSLADDRLAMNVNTPADLEQAEQVLLERARRGAQEPGQLAPSWPCD